MRHTLPRRVRCLLLVVLQLPTSAAAVWLFATSLLPLQAQWVPRLQPQGLLRRLGGFLGTPYGTGGRALFIGG